VKRKLVVWGASGHALVVADIVRLQGEYEIVGFLDDVNPERRGIEFCEAFILGGKEQLDNLKEMGVEYCILAFGNCRARLRLSKLVRDSGFRLATAIHPSAVIAADVPVGSGTVIGAGAVIKPGATIGENAIINSCTSIGHHCIIGDGVHICPGVCLAGGVRVCSAAWVGIGAIVIEHVTIGRGSLVGAGAVVLRYVPDNMVAYGVPARVIRKVDAV